MSYVFWWLRWIVVNLGMPLFPVSLSFVHVYPSLHTVHVHVPPSLLSSSLSLPPFLPPSLPLSLPPSLPLSLPPFLPPSPSLPSSFSLSSLPPLSPSPPSLYAALFLFLFFFTTPAVLLTSVDQIRAILTNATHTQVSLGHSRYIQNT